MKPSNWSTGGRNRSTTALERQEAVTKESTTTNITGTDSAHLSATVFGQPSHPPILSECLCTDTYGTAHDFCYHLPENESIHGRRFSCDFMATIDRLGLLNTSDIPFAVVNFSNPVFVTAFSLNHQHEAINLMESIAKYFPKQRVIAYDLGGVQIDFSKKYNFVETRLFNFSLYPDYVKDLRHYRWKPIIIAETLAEFGAIWYMDSSVVFKKSDLDHVYQLVKCRNEVVERPPLESVAERDRREKETRHESGWDIQQWKRNLAECRKAAYLMHGYSGHGIYPATSPEIYKFIPTNFTEIKKPKAKMYEAGFVFAVRTKDTIEKIVKWYVLCALEKDCMAGNHKEHLFCSLGLDRFASPPKCHRYDQSVVNLLAANAFWYDRHYYVSEIVDFFNIVRG
uniref:Uncharacterized protein n=1 Tax=Haemonchus contortus TaxID=6289 RepID=A0A7I4XYI6_HAECO